MLYIQVSTLPLFYQEVLGYTALTAGIMVAPRGIGSMPGLLIFTAGKPLTLGTLNRLVQQQALLWAFIDIFRWAALFALLAGALAWLFRKVPLPGRL